MHLTTRFLFCLTLAGLLAACAPTSGEVDIIDPWTPEAPPGRMMAGFMQIDNGRADEIVLVDAQSPQFGHVEIHTMVMEDGVMRMRRLEELRIPAGQTVVLEPGGLHIMLIEPLDEYPAGSQIEIELITRDGERIALQSEVRPRSRPGG